MTQLRLQILIMQNMAASVLLKRELQKIVI